ncbi:MAG: alkaline phosphatase [Sedimentisphaerales bacterium]|nr:alkaline phosphatase [Sedimentisphaerales bacterium]
MKPLFNLFLHTAYHICLILLLFSITVFAAPAKNVILMISDGAGFNMFDSASYYQYGQLGRQIYDSFPIKLGCTTYSLDKQGRPVGYDQQKIWSDFKYARNVTDSAAAMTALNTGIKTINGRIGMDKKGECLVTFAQFADSLGKSIGTVSSVPFPHPTPAGVWAHNESRKNYSQIANEMIYHTGLDVIMGGGHPKYDGNGKLLSKTKWHPNYFGDMEAFDKIASGSYGWTFIDSKFDFEALANNNNPEYERVLGVAQVSDTLQQGRSKGADYNINVPTLEVMARGAINVLAKDEDGFYLMVEGGAVDWANHGNDFERAVEEQVNFNKVVEAVVNWVNDRSNWNETLLIVTSDHECGQIWGPKAGPDSEIPFGLPENNGLGKLPSAKYFHDYHTNVLVPLFAIGNGSKKFNELIDDNDPKAADVWQFSGDYVDNTDIFTVMKNAITIKTEH